MRTAHKGGCTCPPCKSEDRAFNAYSAPETLDIMVSAVNAVFGHIRIDGQPFGSIQVPRGFMEGPQLPTRILKRRRVTS